MTGAVIKNVEDFEGSHSFLAEELLQPMTDRNDVGRTIMFTSHIAQAVVLNEPEIPRVFTNFENAFGRYTTAMRRLPKDAEVISVFEKNPLQKVYALRYSDGTVGIHFGAPVRHLTERYGYLLDNGHMDSLIEKHAGGPIPAGSLVQGWSCSDEDGNFRYGVNLNTLYANRDGLTYEDGLIVSESAAQRMAHTTVERITVVLNANDLCIDLYGEGDGHKGFPDVGEQVKEGVLLARRRINHETILHDLSAPQLARINWDSDTCFFAEGTVVDVDVFSNLSEAELDKHEYNAQLLGYYRRARAFSEWFDEHLTPYVTGEKPGGYHPDVAFHHRRVQDGKSRWRYERTEFDGVVVVFTIARRVPLAQGSKITNRFGGKGVIAAIWPDSDMPVSESGRRADLIVNSLGVNNRLNYAQLYESELNYIADRVAEQMRSMDPAAAWEHMMRFLKIVSKEQYAWMEANVSPDERAAVVEEVTSGREPIRIHQQPFYGNVQLADMAEAYAEFGIGPERVEGIENPMIIGTNYYVRLRHEPDGKLSARSARHLSIKGVPARNPRGVRAGTEHHSTTPIRLGEQELQNLLIADNPEEMKRMLRLYASDDVSREGAVMQLMTRPDPFSTERVEARGDGITRPVAGLMALLESIGLHLELGEGEGAEDDASN